MTDTTPAQALELSARAEELLAELAREFGTQEGLFGPGGLIPQLTKRLVEQALAGEMSHHLAGLLLLAANSFTPDLTQLDAMMRSLEFK